MYVSKIDQESTTHSLKKNMLAVAYRWGSDVSGVCSAMQLCMIYRRFGEHIFGKKTATGGHNK